jgi:serine/threonine protein kinase
MTPERYQRIAELFNDALALEVERRADFLNQACGEDQTLRREVELLLNAHLEAGSFIERPPLEIVAEAFNEAESQDLVGLKVGHYEVLSLLGAGGMGKVYLAQDTRLARKVAIKILPSEYTSNKSSVRRFVQEAQAASALNHPNIITIYEIGEAAGTRYLVTEYIDGQTLRQRLADGRLDLLGATEIVLQVASALAAAHEAGIIHRDIKPENLMVRRDGIVKVLDFGLAKLIERPVQVIDSEAPTMAKVNTDAGIVMGTANYMSPEQARGLKMDARTDIFSLGVVFYEMIAGCNPFTGDTISHVIVSILEDEPQPLTTHRPEIPLEMEHIVSKTLAKNREDRYQSVKDLIVDLKKLRKRLEIAAEMEETVHLAPVSRLTESPGGRRLTDEKAKRLTLRNTDIESRQNISRRSTPAGGVSRRKMGWLLLVSLIVLVLAGTGLWLLNYLSRNTARPAQLARTLKITRLTSDSGLTTDPVLSNDGKFLAFASDRGSEGNLDIWVQYLNDGEPLRITHDTADDYEPSFSPDGSKIIFRSERGGGGVYVVSSFGGEARLVAKHGRSPSFSPDGSQFAYMIGDVCFSQGCSKIYIAPLTGGPHKQLQPNFDQARHPVWSPDGTHILFWGVAEGKNYEKGDWDWWVTPIDGSKAVKTRVFEAFRRQKLAVGSYDPVRPEVWQKEGNQIIFSAKLGDITNLWQIALSPENWQITGDPRQLTSGTGQEGRPSMANGSLVFSTEDSINNIWSLPIDHEGKVRGELQQLTNDAAEKLHLSVSATGQKLVFVSINSEIHSVMMRNLSSRRETALATAKMAAQRQGLSYVPTRPLTGPIISPDGSRVAYSSKDGNKRPIFAVDAEGGMSEKVCDDCGRPWGFSADGERIAYLTNPDHPGVGLFNLATKEKFLLLNHPTYNLWQAHFSPDDRWIAFVAATGPGRNRIFIAPLREGVSPETEWIAITDGNNEDNKPRWSPDGNLLYFTSERDGFRCLWGQRLAPSDKRPVGQSFAVHHFHNARRSMMKVSVGALEISVAHDKLVFNLAETKGNIWLAKPDN